MQRRIDAVIKLTDSKVNISNLLKLKNFIEKNSANLSKYFSLQDLFSLLREHLQRSKIIYIDFNYSKCFYYIYPLRILILI